MTDLSWPLATERLTLRMLRTDDLDAVHDYERRDDVARYVYRPPLDRERVAAGIARRLATYGWRDDDDGITAALCRHGDDRVIGQVSLRLASAAARQAEIGWILHPEHGGHGYATEAARAMGALAFDRLGVHRLFARLDVENTASIRLCERLGMRREAHLIENDVHPDGRFGSEYVYAVRSAEFRR